jgi:hypothetical protein
MAFEGSGIHNESTFPSFGISSATSFRAASSSACQLGYTIGVPRQKRDYQLCNRYWKALS